MINQVITINRKKYAVGLFWQPTGTGYVARSYARSLARSVDKRLNLFTEYRGMVGLGSKRAGHKTAMLSAAAEVMESLAEFTSFLAVFQVNNIFYLVAIRNGVILEDKIFDNEQSARDSYFTLSEIPDWGALFAPAAWGMPRSVERNLEDLMNARTHAALRPIGRVKTVLVSLGIIAIFLLGLLYFFREPIGQMLAPKPQISTINPELAAEYKRQIEEKNKELDAEFNIEKAQPEPIVLPYDYLPNPITRAASCYQAIGFLMQPVVGWYQVSAECNETHAVADFMRGFGTLGEFYNIATELMPASYVQQNSEDSLTVRATLPKLPTFASLDERDADTVLRDVMTVFQSIDGKINAEIVIDTLTNGVDVVQLNVVEIEAESKLVPMQFMEIFNEFGGVYMTRCAWDADRRTWNYEVIIYAK